MMRILKIATIAVLALVVVVSSGIFCASQYYTSQRGQGCASCHEMASLTNAVHGSSHRNVGCLQCHALSLETQLRHVRAHLSGKAPEAIHLRTADVLEMQKNCRNCHQKEYAEWQAGPHSATYSRIFTNPAQNGKHFLIEDCLRCHGMHFDGSVRDLVQPMNAKGPWKIVRAGFADQPTMPCSACHSIHAEGALSANPGGKIAASDAPAGNSLAFFDRRESQHFGVGILPMPAVFEKARAVKMSADPRIALCAQCHAARQPETGTDAATNHWGPQAGSGDDRTPTGVHEGLSCLACHGGHAESAKASCKTCHGKTSECGLDVEKMDTTFLNAASPHNIHSVHCTDCHQNGIPKAKIPQQLSARTPHAL